jgi:hypothetical protein
MGCTPQQRVAYSVELKNACNYPIDVSSPQYVDYLASKKHLNSGETMFVIVLYCTDASRLFTMRTSSWAIDAMGGCLKNDYKLTITAGDKERILDKQQVLNAMQRAEYEDEKIRFHWTISDPSLCPK